MGKWIPVLILAVAVVAFFVTSGGTERKILRIYNWADYVSPEVVSAFEKEFGCQVVIDTFDSNEAMLAKLKAGATGYDIVIPTEYAVNIMIDDKMAMKLDHAKLPNLRHMDAEYVKLMRDKTLDYSVPYMVSITGIGYNPKKVPDFKPSWTVFANPACKGRMTMLNDMRECIGAALKVMGKSLNTTNEQDLAAAQQLLIGCKKNLAKFDVDEAKRGLVTGEFFVVHGYNGDLLQIIEEAPEIAFAVPEEGTSIAIDCMVIPTGAKNVDLAHAFINYIHEPKNCAMTMEKVCFASPNTEAVKLLPQEFRTNKAIFLDKAVLAKCELIEDLGAENAKYTKVWDAVKSAE